MPETKSSTRAGFVAFLGGPNAGKSTLVNRIVGAKVSIVSPKVQTTRTRVLGIAIHNNAQMILVDTPGVFKPKRRLDRAMVASAWAGAEDADLICILVDAKRGLDGNTRTIIAKVKDSQSRATLILNKIDLIDKERLLALSQELFETGVFEASFMISALNGDGVEDLTNFLVSRMPDGPWLFPEDQISDMPEYLLAAEITREQLYHQLQQELPYAATVETESWEDFDDGSIKISQIIYIERDSQKGIVLGKHGKRIKSIREAAQAELAKILNSPVHLFLFLKVKDNWGNDRERFETWGLDFDA